MSLTLLLLTILSWNIGIVYGTNHAPFASCSASSEYSRSYNCGLAKDGRTNNCRSFVFVSKHQKIGEYWKGSFKSPVKVTSVTIYNRVYKLSLKRMNNFKIQTDEGTCASYESEISFKVKTFKCDATTSSIKIITQQAKYVELCEVVVNGPAVKDDPEDKKDKVLPFTSCSASSEYSSKYSCGLAKDGKTNNCRSKVFVSKHQKIGEYWKGSFKTAVKVTSVTIYNRVNMLQLKRMNDFKIQTDEGMCASYESGTSFKVETLICNAMTSSIKIITQQAKYLEICEVVVHG